ncbi:DNA-directed RNA polymerase alpha subunit, putative [Bodo saltans]|uniref:Plastid-encoded RNA polymerase subunit alpha n=1 Tax=Bodo saltans TaxID=75058 RepID=A0A0S4IYI3_BODSA|nr:DNA-directed RNA polymerase alpha subunit, putative [Bodo saltans]|eukprot:CUF74874.1 DNA-directed RNA polymerase alpha subunit, putative [Bodo saltans]
MASVKDRARVGRDRIENVETSSSPHTFGSGAIAMPESCIPDVPTISNIVVVSALAGDPSLSKASGVDRAESEGPATTHRVQTLTFDLQRVSAPTANMFRRVFVTEVPTAAFDRIMIEENDGVVLDEILSHRLGMCPVAAPVDKLEYITDSQSVSFSRLDASRCIVFELDVCGKPNIPITPVYSGELKWVPLPGQESWGNEVFIVHQDIMLAKLGPNQRIKLRAVAIKGLGLSHTKWSPVSACFYEMKTDIQFSSPVVGEAAQELRKACPMRVFDVEDSGQAVVSRPRDCTLCRECLRVDRYPAFAESIKIEKLKTNFHFTIETTGQLSAEVVFRNGLQQFAERMRDLAKTLTSSEVKVTGVA